MFIFVYNKLTIDKFKNCVYNNIRMKIPEYLKVESAIREKIERGKLKPGTKLPSEPELASIYKVSRGTLRKSLKLLVAEGFIYQIPGKGTFVTSPEDKKIEIIRKKQNYLRKINKGIGILIPCITESLFPGIVRGAEDVLREKGYHIMLGNYDVSWEKEKEYMEMFVERGVSGLIISPSFNSYLNPYYDILKKKNIPFVLTDVSINGIESDLVCSDNLKGAYEGTKYLISYNCKRILFLAGKRDVSSTKERFLGFKEAMEEGGLPLIEDLIKFGDFSEEFGYKSTKEILLREKIDGIFSANEPITVGVFKAIKEVGYSDIKIASFDEPDILFDLNLNIILIKQKRYEIGKYAAKLLLEKLEGKKKNENKEFKKILIPPEIIEIKKIVENKKGDENEKNKNLLGITKKGGE